MTEMAGIYELTLLRYPYKIYYRVEQEEIWCFTYAIQRVRTGETSDD